MCVHNAVNAALLGEAALVSHIEKLFVEQPRFILNVFGDHGTGKTAVLTKIGHIIGKDKDAKDLVYLDCTEVAHGEQIDPYVNDKQILLLDNVDNRFSKDQFKEIVLNLCSQDPHVRIVFTSKMRLFSETIPGIPAANLEVGNRVFSYAEFLAYIRGDNRSPMPSDLKLSDTILKNIFLFATYCRNFNYVLDLIAKLGESERKTKHGVTPREFIDILTNSTLFTRINRDVAIDTDHVPDRDYLFVIRAKDKIEKLRDILMRYYPEEQILFEVMRNQFNTSFVDEAFRHKTPFPERVLNICMLYDPVELLVKLLGPRDIIFELTEQRVGEACFTYSIEDKAKLILKHIGLNIMDDLKGLTYYSEWFQTNNGILTDNHGQLNKEYVIGLGISCFQEMEHIFHEMLQFYARYFCGSVLSFVNSFNDSTRQQLLPHRITFGQYIGLLSYLNRLAKEERYQLKMLTLGRPDVVPAQLLKMMEAVSSHRAFLTHHQDVKSAEIPDETYRGKIAKIYASAGQIVDILRQSAIFPEIIKIKQIIFDEFGRTLYVASDWKKNEIRFSLSNALSHAHIFSHYYLLRKGQSISINPIIMPRYYEEQEALFRDGEQYDKSSQTQLLQGVTLISHVKTEDGMNILDVGCGNGKTTLELFGKNPAVHIDAFDVSEHMIEQAIKNREDLGIGEESVKFRVMDVMKLDAHEEYDIVFSNAALHWLTDSHAAYSKLHQSLKPGGQLAVHQGGDGCYKGLHECVKEAIKQLDLQTYYRNWTYPIFYPKKSEMENLLTSIGYRKVKVISHESDGTEFPDLVENFASAGMLAYLQRLPDENLRGKLKSTYSSLCRTKKVDTYTHRIYVFAMKEGGHGEHRHPIP
jgi:trans-aconitate methyltransferase